MTLIGTWVVDESDRHALAELGDVLLDFNENGALTYVIRADGKQQIILMQYEVDGDAIVTDQPSAPRVERTSFSLSDDGKLVLAFGGEPFTFRRASEG